MQAELFEQPTPTAKANAAKVYTVREVKLSTVREELVTAPPIIRTAEDATRFYRAHVRRADWYDGDKEAFVCLMLDRRYRVKGYALVSFGILDASLVHPREVFRAAVLAAAAAVVVIHNHPSGDTTPSAEDLRVTRQVVEAGKILGIEVLDHVIQTDEPDGRPLSLRESGLVKFND